MTKKHQKTKNRLADIAEEDQAMAKDNRTVSLGSILARVRHEQTMKEEDFSFSDVEEDEDEVPFDEVAKTLGWSMSSSSSKKSKSADNKHKRKIEQRDEAEEQEEEEEKDDMEKKAKRKQKKKQKKFQYPSAKEIKFHVGEIDMREPLGDWAFLLLQNVIENETAGLKELFRDRKECEDVNHIARKWLKRFAKKAKSLNNVTTETDTTNKLNPKNIQLQQKELELKGKLLKCREEIQQWEKVEAQRLKDNQKLDSKQEEEEEQEKKTEQPTESQPQEEEMHDDELGKLLEFNVEKSVARLKFVNAKLRAIKKLVLDGNKVSSQLAKDYESQIFKSYADFNQPKTLIKNLTAS